MAKKKRMLSDGAFAYLMAKARKTNRERSRSDIKSKCAPPESDVVSLIHTAATAIECGLKVPDVNAVAEGLAMIQHAHKILHSGPQQRVFDDIRYYRHRCRMLRAKDN